MAAAATTVDESDLSQSRFILSKKSYYYNENIDIIIWAALIDRNSVEFRQTQDLLVGLILSSQRSTSQATPSQSV